MDAELVDAIKYDYDKAPLDAQDRAMLDFAIRITKDATEIRKADLDGLRSVGFDDVAILQITLIASWFNYINRVADALGVGRDEGSDEDDS